MSYPAQAERVINMNEIKQQANKKVIQNKIKLSVKDDPLGFDLDIPSGQRQKMVYMQTRICPKKLDA